MIDPTLDPAGYFAERLRHQYGLSTPTTLKELQWVCECEGVPIVEIEGLDQGYHVQNPRHAIAVPKGYTRLHLAHEIYHYLVSDRTQHDAWPGYSGSAKVRQQLEQDDAIRFSEILCSIPKTLLAPTGAVVYAWAIQDPMRSTTRQLRLCREWARAQGLECAGNYVDSGAPFVPLPERRAGQRLMSELWELRKQGVGTVILAHWSRLAPAACLREPLVRAINELAVEVESLQLLEWERPSR